MKQKFFLIALQLCIFTLVTHGQGKGHLVIAGGGLNPSNKEAYSRLVELAGGPEKAVFAIIPTAGGWVNESYTFMKDVLGTYGVKAENIHLIPISELDDETTADVDESTWAGNANDEKLADLVRQCTGIWFSGGDQMRVTRTHFRPDGSRTPVLQAVWEVYEKGGVIGGTSAGAALMSDVMIGNGTSLGALQMKIIYNNGPDNEDTDALLISRGMGFFPEGIIDQHFTARARLGRLIIALMHSKDKYQMAFGVDENTALVYSAAERTIQVAGTGGITLLDASKAEMVMQDNLPEIKDLSLSYLEQGDTYLAATKTILPEEGKKATVGHESTRRQNLFLGGILSPSSGSFQDIITY
ncbi:MAG: cyanophycinase, partial [Bacteroidales bacterium]|nr:cyanophycinase [Bacteroidales bacterium]